MPNYLRLPALTTALLALGFASAAPAQANPVTNDSSAEPASAPAKVTTVPESGATSSPSRRSRVMSNEVAATLATGMPKYNPPPKLPEPKPEDEQVDLRETDKPKNKIIRLPKFTVKEEKPPVFRDRDLHTKSELTDMALRRYAGLKIGNLGGLNRPTALLMYQEQERLGDLAELKNDARDAQRSGDTTASDYITRETNRVYYRPSDFGWNSDNPGK